MVKYNTIKIKSRAIFDMFRTMCPVDQTYEDFLSDLLSLRQEADVIELETAIIEGKCHVIGFKQAVPMRWPYPDKPLNIRGRKSK